MDEADLLEKLRKLIDRIERLEQKSKPKPRHLRLIK
jgi:hypothetical protein